MLQTQTVSPSTLSLLKALLQLESMNGLNLAGGTALSLQIGHRISVDLDFFGERKHSFDDILLEMSGIGKVEILRRSGAILTLFLNGVKVDVVNYSYKLLKPINEIEGIRLLSLADISAMKLGAISGRGRMRDFYDLYFLMRQFSLHQILDFFETKFPDGSRFLVLKSLIYFKDAESDDDIELLENVPWDEVKKKITAEHRLLTLST